MLSHIDDLDGNLHDKNTFWSRVPAKDEIKDRYAEITYS
jgi:hypothetical protein